MASDATSMVAWVALATAGVGLLAILFIILLYTVNSVFGSLNDICNGLLGILSGVLAVMLYDQYGAQSPLLGLVGLVLALAGAVVVVVGSALVVSGRTGWYRAGFYTMAGFAGIGLWLVGQNLLVQPADGWPQSLVIAGLVVGGLMILGLAALPGLFSGIDSWQTSPWYLKYIGMSASSLGWLVLYPLWCLWLGLTFLFT
ncbi:MAG: hypothetical protein P8189_16785 [Anaerolineae bacterium]